MQNSLRKTLIDSHVAAIAIAVLFFSSAAETGFALWDPVCRVFSFLTSTVAVRLYLASSIPSTPGSATYQMLLTAHTNLLLALYNLAAAWLLSRWVYGTGPLRSLGNYRDKLSRKTNA